MNNARELSSRLQLLLRREQGAQADFLVALADFDRWRLWVELGYSSLFHYLNRELGMSKGAAHYRKTAAERVPTRTVVTVMPVLVAARPVAHAASGSTVEPTAPATLPAPDRTACASAAVAPQHSSTPRAEAEPLTADLRRLHVTVSKRFMEKLEAARDALSHSHPGADVEDILEAGLDALIDRAAKRRGLVKRPRAAAPPADDEGPENGRYVPAAVRREVWVRDEGCCQWPTSDGGICGSTHRCELDHVVPVARGGRSTVSNLRIVCRVHNGLAAREAYGDDWMDMFTTAGRRGGMRAGGPREGAQPSRATV